MLVIRLFRTGKKNQSFFKIVVTDKRKASRGGRFIAEVGFLNPRTKENSLNKEKIKHWLSVGAKASDTVYNLLIKEKIIEGKKIPVHKKKKMAETPQAQVKKEAATLKTEPAKKETPVAEPSKTEAPKPEVPAAPVVPSAEIPKTENK